MNEIKLVIPGSIRSKKNSKRIYSCGRFKRVLPCGDVLMKITLPFSVTLQRKTKDDKNFNLNLNIYRNTHHMVLNQAKIAWKEIVRMAVERDLITGPPYAFTYTAFPASNRKFDLGNVLSIVQKFTDDALIEMGIINDDSYKVIPIVSYKFGGVDKENPRIELEINTLFPV